MDFYGNNTFEFNVGSGLRVSTYRLDSIPRFLHLKFKVKGEEDVLANLCGAYAPPLPVIEQFITVSMQCTVS